MRKPIFTPRELLISTTLQMLKSADQDSEDEPTEGVQKMQLTGESELLKLQGKQRMAIEKAREQQREGSGAYNVNQYGFQASGSGPQSLHADLQNLTFEDPAHGDSKYVLAF